MKRSLLGAAVALACVVGVATVAPGAASAGPGTPRNFERVALDGLKFTPAMAKAGQQQVKVIVQLRGASVAQRVAAARAHGDRLSAAERSAIRADLRRDQQGVRSVVGASGGRTLAAYQDAYNGVAVKVARSQLAALAAASGVVALHAVHTSSLNDVAGNQYIGGPQAWQNTGFTGAGVKVAIIDTGVDYTHADFGGAGTEAAFTANDPDVVEPGTFPTAKVVGGYDFVGDDYDADNPDHDVPQPDGDPLDCNGHGSHVAGIAAGDGVLADHSTFTGPYDDTTYTNSFSVGPGVAPEALIYAYKVFGCEGTVDNSIVVAAMNRAMQDNVNVINMSLGSPFGTADDPEAVAVNNLALAGIRVVASAGNSGASPYITGAPATADRAISVAALDASRATVPGAHAVFSNTSGTVDLQDSNEAPFPEGQTLPVKVLRNSDGSVSLGCDPAEYVNVTGALVVTKRGTCARVARAIFGQQAGAAAVVMINSDSAYPPMEGEITSNPDTGEAYHVTIPFFGAPGTTAATTTLLAADGGTVTLTHTDIANPGYQRLASFTSGGPRNGDSAVKPDVTAPGVAILSAGVGTGYKAATISGTSQASPATAGTAALVTQAHPSWSTAQVKAAIMNTADPSLDLSYNVRLSGAGVVQAQKAVATDALILAGNGQSTLSYGAEAIATSYSETLPMTIENHGSGPESYDLSGTFNGSARGAVISASPSSVTVPPGGSQTVQVTLSISPAAAAALPSAESSNFGALVSIRGAVVATPTAGADYALRVPFLVAPHGLSNVHASAAASPPTVVNKSDTFATSTTVTNAGSHDGNADVYAWGVSDRTGDSATPYVDVRAAGVQAFTGDALGGDPADRALVFAVNMAGPWSTAAKTEVDVPIYADGDNRPDGYVVGLDLGYITTGSYDGRYAALTIDAAGNVVDTWVADAPMNGSTMELPALASELGLSSSRSTFRYGVASFDLLSSSTDSTSLAGFDAWSPAVSNGEFASLAAGQSATIPLTFRQSAVSAHALGWMVVTLDDAAGAAQADLVALPKVSQKH